MTELNSSTPLHKLIAGEVRWTDSLWPKAFSYLDEVVTEEGSESLEAVLLGSPSAYSTREDRLKEFRRYPPTVLLGAFDLLRWGDAVYEMVDQVVDAAEAESTARLWKSARRNARRDN